MLNKNKLFVFIFSVFVLFTTNGFSNSSFPIHSGNKLVPAESLSQNRNSSNDASILSIEGVLQASIKVSETSAPVFRNFKDQKKSISFIIAYRFETISRSVFASYHSTRIKRCRISPVYLATRRLII